MDVINSLYHFFDNNKNDMPDYGLSNKVSISCVVVIDIDGNYQRYIRNLDDKGYSFSYDGVPYQVQRTSDIKANLLYDKPEYFLPIGDLKRNETFVNKIKEFTNECDEHLRPNLIAIQKFYENGQYNNLKNDLMSVYEMQKESDMKKNIAFCDEIENLTIDDYLLINSKSPKFITKINLFDKFTFQIDTNDIRNDDVPIICDENYKDSFIKYYNNHLSDDKKDDEKDNGFDMITGEYGALSSLFGSNGSSFISFNLESSCSYGRGKLFNIPMSHETAFKIYNSISHLIKDESHHFKVGNKDMIVWSTDIDEKFILDEINDVIGLNKNVSENKNNVIDQKEKFDSVFVGKKKAIRDRNSDFYIMIMDIPQKNGRMSINFFNKCKVKDLFDNLDNYHKMFHTYENYFVTPKSVIECFNTASGKVISNFFENKKNDNLYREMLKMAIFGGKFNDEIVNNILYRIERENSISYSWKTGKECLYRISCLNAYVSQFVTLDEYKYQSDLDNYHYQLGAFLGVAEFIKRKYKNCLNKNNILIDGFRAFLNQSSNDIMIDNIIKKSKYYASCFNEKDKLYYVGNDETKEKWWTDEKGNKFHKFVKEHNNGKLDFLKIKIDSFKGINKNWNTFDKSMFVIGFYRMINNLNYYDKKSANEEVVQG